MKLKPDFLMDLDFKPSNEWPASVPALALSNQLICGFNLSSHHPVFEHTFQNQDHSLILLKSIYPQLTLPELARLIKSPVFSQYFEIDSLLKAYQYHASPELTEILNLLFNCNSDFQNFVSFKKIGPQELVPLLMLDEDNRIFVTQEVLNANESKQDSVKRIELLCDLIQMKNTTECLQDLNQNQLLQLRHPVTTSRDQSLSATSLPWSSQIKKKFKRQGDKAGFDIQFFAGTPVELNKLAQNLTKVAQEWNLKA